MRKKWNDVLGGLLVALAVLLERSTVGRRAARRWRQYRDATLRAAHDRGVPVEVLAARVGLSPGRVRAVLKADRP